MISIVKKSSGYDDRGYEQANCDYEIIYDFTCEIPTEGGETVTEVANSKATVELRNFFIKTWLQNEQAPYDVEVGQYVAYTQGEAPAAEFFAYEVIGVKMIRTKGRCCILKLSTKRLVPRECETLRVYCEGRKAVAEV